MARRRDTRIGEASRKLAGQAGDIRFSDPMKGVIAKEKRTQQHVAKAITKRMKQI